MKRMVVVSAEQAARVPDLDLEDAQIIEQTLCGEPEAFNLLVHRWERQIYGLALRMLGRDDEAKDATQETFLSAYRNLSKFRGEAKFSSWIYRIALNICNTRLRGGPRTYYRSKSNRRASGSKPSPMTRIWLKASSASRLLDTFAGRSRACRPK